MPHSNAKIIAKLAKKDMRIQRHALKAQRKYKKRMANKEIKKIRLQRKNWLRILNLLQIIIPLIIPAIYRIVTSMRSTENTNLVEKIEDIKVRVRTSNLPAAQINDFISRLDSMTEAVKSAQFLGEPQRAQAYRAVSRDLDTLIRDLGNSK